MKRLASAFATVLILVTVASAQSGSFIVADVPFTFHVQDTHVSSGTYRISYQGSTNGYLVLTDGKEINMVAGLTFREKQPQSTEIPKLVFYKYGDEYFLVAVKMPDRTVHSVGNRAKVTHQLITKGQPEEVIVLARAVTQK